MSAAAKPDDVVPSELWYREETPYGFNTWAVPNLDGHEEYCRTYWASHGCSRPRGHDGPCWCDCCECDDHARDHKAEGCVAGPPYFGLWTTRFWGEDAPRRPVVEVTWRIAMRWHAFRVRHRWGSYRLRDDRGG